MVELPQALRASAARGELTPVVGSGASIAATGEPSSPASWRGLLRHGIKYAESQGLLSDGDCVAAQTLIESGQLSSVATLIKEALQQYRADWLQDAYGSMEIQDGNRRLHEMIGAVSPGLVVTTNYDDLLERSLDRGPVSWTATEFANALSDGRHARNQVLHLHGYYADEPSVILDAADYTRLEASAAMEAFAVAAAQRSLLFVGCGPDGLRDAHFSQLWRWLERLGTSAQHFVLLPASTEAKAELRTAGASKLTFVLYDDSGERPAESLALVLEQLASEASLAAAQLQGMGRAAVRAPRVRSVERRMVLIQAEPAPIVDQLTHRPELRSNFHERLQRLLSRETRGADLCILTAHLARDEIAAVCRNSDAPLLIRLADGSFDLLTSDGTTMASSLRLPATVSFGDGLPTVTPPDLAATSASFTMVETVSQLPRGQVGLCFDHDTVRVIAPPAEVANAQARVRRDDEVREMATPPSTSDAVLVFEMVGTPGDNDELSNVAVHEVIYGLEQSSFARLSRVVEGLAPLTDDAGRELRSALEGLSASAFSLLRRDLAAALRSPGTETYLHHIAAPSHLRSPYEALYEATSEDTSAEKVRLELLSRIRPSLRRAGDASAALATDGKGDRRLLVAASLGEFDIDQAAKTFPPQRTLLAFVAERRLRLTYTLVSRQSARDASMTDRYFFIHCFGSSDRPGTSVAESQSVAAVVQSAFHNNYSVSYSTAVPQDLHDADVASGDAADYSRVWIVPKADGAWPVSDYGLIADYIRTLPGDVAVTWECSGDLTHMSAVAPQGPPADAIGGHEASLAATPFDNLRRLAADPAFSTRNIALRCLVSVRGVEENAVLLAREVGTLVGTEVFGANQFHVENEGAGGYTAVPIGQALLAMHAPFGQMYATSFDTTRRFVMSLKDQRLTDGVPMGTATRKRADRDQVELVRLSEDERYHHVHVVGRPGTGKTTLLKRMILGDLTAGHGVTVVDPHGGLADWTIENVPSDRSDDTILIDLDNRSHAPVLNLLDVAASHSEDYERVVAEIIHFVRSRNYHEWSGPAFEQLVRLALLSMRDSGYPSPPALTELPLLLGNDRMRSAIGRCATNEELRDGWRLQSQQGHQHGAEVLQWVIAKFDELTKDPILRAFLGGERSTLDVRGAVQEGKILIFRLASTRISQQASDFIGSMFLTVLQQSLLDMATSRDRSPHFVYIDEFHRFATLGLERLVVEARKFKVGMTLAHQNLSQLSAFQQHTGRYLEGISSTLVGNAGTLVVFPVSSYDREQLGRELGCQPGDIGRLARFQALVRTSVTAGSIQPFTIEIDDMGEPDAAERTARLARRMRDEHLWLPIGEILDAVSERHANLRRWAAQDSTPPPATGGGRSSASPKQSTQSPSPVSKVTSHRDTDGRDDLSPFLRDWLEKRDAEEVRHVAEPDTVVTRAANKAPKRSDTKKVSSSDTKTPRRRSTEEMGRPRARTSLAGSSTRSTKPSKSQAARAARMSDKNATPPPSTKAAPAKTAKKQAKRPGTA